MRILHVLSQRPSHTGSGTTLDAIVRQASKAGYVQHVIVGTPAEDPLPAVGDLPRDHVRPLVFGKTPLEFLLPGMSDVMPYASSRYSQLTAAQLDAYRDAWRAHVVRVVDVYRPDVIHSHHVWLLSSLLKDIAPDIPVVTHCHGTGLRQLKLCPHLADEVTRGCARNDVFLALHCEQAEEIVDSLQIAPDRVRVVGAGYRDDVFHRRGRTPRAEPTLLYAGKLSRSKGLPQLLAAIEKLQVMFPNIHLNIAGSGAGDEADELRRRMAAMSARVTWHGQLSPVGLAELMRQCSLFVLPSFYEGLALVLVEAVACGCRVVTTALPGTLELHEQLPSALHLVPPPAMQSVDVPIESALPAFVDRLTLAIAAELRSPSPIPADQLAQAFTWSAVFRRIEHVWREVLARSVGEE